MFSLKIYKRNTIFFNNLCFLYTNITISTYKQVHSKRYYLSHELKS